MKTTYHGRASRYDEWWMISIPQLDGLTQARQLNEVEHMARSWIAVTLDVNIDSFDIDIAIDGTN